MTKTHIKLVSEADIDRITSHLMKDYDTHKSWRVVKLSDLKSMLASAPEVGEAVRFERLHPSQGWIIVEQQDIPHYQQQGQEIRALYTTPQPDRTEQLEQILQDPENQPSQYGTVPLSIYETTRLRQQLEIAMGALNGVRALTLETLVEAEIDEAIAQIRELEK